MFKVVGVHHPRIGGPDIIVQEGELATVLQQAVPSLSRYDEVAVVELASRTLHDYPRDIMKQLEGERFLIAAISPENHIHVDGASFESESKMARELLASKGFREISEIDRRVKVTA